MMQLSLHDIRFERRAVYGGCDLVAAPHMTETVEDWSAVRSPSRARRRMKQGHRQNVRHVTVPSKDVVTDQRTGTMYAHPATIDAIVKAMSAKLDRLAADTIMGRVQ